LFFFSLARSKKDEEQKEKNMLEEIQTVILGVEK
jgi:preprotein translocase subunit YajC